MFCRLKVHSYVLAANVAGTLKVAPLQTLRFPVVLPHKLLDAERFNLQYSDAAEITEIMDKLLHAKLKTAGGDLSARMILPVLVICAASQKTCDGKLFKQYLKNGQTGIEIQSARFSVYVSLLPL